MALNYNRLTSCRLKLDIQRKAKNDQPMIKFRKVTSKMRQFSNL